MCIIGRSTATQPKNQSRAEMCEKLASIDDQDIVLDAMATVKLSEPFLF